MPQVVVEPELAEVLQESKGPTAIVDRTGRKLGVYVPQPIEVLFQDLLSEDELAELYAAAAKRAAVRKAYDKAWVEFNREEFEAALAEGPGRPLEDILRDLETRQ